MGFGERELWARERFLAAAVVEAPAPWRAAGRPVIAIGGLVGVGFAVHPEHGRDLLFVASHSGYGLFDAAGGERPAREDEPEEPYPDGDLRCPGIGVVAGVAVRVAGLFGGGLHAVAPGGWTVDVVAPDWPHQRVLLSRGHGPYASDDWWHVHHETVSAVRAAGFSPSGDTFVVATGSDVTVWVR